MINFKPHAVLASNGLDFTTDRVEDINPPCRAMRDIHKPLAAILNLFLLILCVRLYPFAFIPLSGAVGAFLYVLVGPKDFYSG